MEVADGRKISRLQLKQCGEEKTLKKDKGIKNGNVKHLVKCFENIF